MMIPFTGAVILLLGGVFFVLSPMLLYAALIVSVPFSATAIVNFGNVGQGKSIMAWQFFGMLWVLRQVFARTPPWRRPGWVSTRASRWALLAFMVAIVISLSVPLLLNGTEWVPSGDALHSEIIPLRFTAYNASQTAYLAFGILLAILLAVENREPGKLRHTLKLYVGSCTFIAGWGMYQLWCNVTGHEYPAFLFNTSTNLSALGYMEVLGEGIGRVSSAALEPSILSEELLLTFIVLLMALKLNRPVITQRWDLIALAMTASTLLVSTSTTAYAGIFIALVLMLITLFVSGLPARLYLFLIVGILALTTLAAELIPGIGDVASILLVHKADTGSGILRFHSVALAIGDFLNHPILGAGWHAVDSSDLVCLILANTGIVGLTAFAIFLIPVLKKLWVLVRQRKPSAMIVLPTISLLLLLAEGSGFAYSTGYIWLFFGLAMAVSASLCNRSIPQGRCLPCLRPAEAGDYPERGVV